MKRGQSLLRAVRAAQQPKVSQMQLARRAGMGLYRYWQIENGEGSPSTKDEQGAIAAVLGVKASDISWPERENARASA